MAKAYESPGEICGGDGGEKGARSPTHKIYPKRYAVLVVCNVVLVYLFIAQWIIIPRCLFACLLPM